MSRGLPHPVGLAAALALVVLAGCSSPARLGDDCPLRRGTGLAVMVHGVFPGGEWAGWEDEMCARLERSGVVAAKLRYRMHLPEYFLGSAMEDAAARITSAAKTLAEAHARTQCPAPFRVAGVGHSAGTRILLEAALQGTHFSRLTFEGSPIFFASSDVAAVLHDRRVQQIVNYHSLVDGLVWPLIPMGVWGYGGDEQRFVENRFKFQLHLADMYGGERERVADETARALVGGNDVHVCDRDPEFVKLTVAVVRALEVR